MTPTEALAIITKEIELSTEHCETHKSTRETITQALKATETALFPNQQCECGDPACNVPN
mgnify:FL=1